MKSLKAYDIVFEVLFDSDEELLKSKKLSEAQLEIKKRCFAIYTRKLADPLIRDARIAEDLSKHFNVSLITIYNDIKAVEYLICAIKKTSKEYARFIVTETQKFAIEKEKKLIKKGKKTTTKDLSYASYILAKAYGLHENDPERINPDDYIIPQTEISDDVTILDLDPMSKEEEERLKRKYLPSHKTIEDADIIED